MRKMFEKLKLPKNPNWEKYSFRGSVEGEPIDPRCPYCETDGHNFGFYHVTKKWLYYVCFLCDEPNDGVFRYQRTNYNPNNCKQRK